MNGWCASPACPLEFAGVETEGDWASCGWVELADGRLIGRTVSIDGPYCGLILCDLCRSTPIPRAPRS